MSTHDNFNEIESMMATLPAREPSQVLDARIASTLDNQTRTTLPWLAIAAAVLIAGAVTLVILLNPSTLTPEAHPPVAFDRGTVPEDSAGNAPPTLTISNPTETLDLTWTRDIVEETRYTPAGEPYRAVVREAVDHKAWINTKTGETSQFRVPREELIIIKQTTF